MRTDNHAGGRPEQWHVPLRKVPERVPELQVARHVVGQHHRLHGPPVGHPVPGVSRNPSR